ncbi:MAG: alpha/beta hydrolase [Deltaproteobacteria bacterium]|nr:MAG: alpha/beta hydrolase [Deltaproteobacteria bacterium]
MDDAVRRLQDIAPTVTRRVRSRDGTSIAYYVVGSGPRTWVIPPGLGTPPSAWHAVFERFKGDFTMVTWDLRGTFRSAVPADLGRLGVADHADDLEAIVAAEGLERFVLGGWSLAVQTSLEYQHRHPEQVEALVLLNGAYEHVLRTALMPGLEGVLTTALRGLAWAGGRFGGLITRAVRLGPDVMPRIGLLASSTPLFGEVLRDFSELDWGVYFKIALAVNRHSAAPYLDAVRVPTLITAGDADRMTPVETAETMHRRIRGSRLVLFPGGTHYTQTEYPDAMNDALAEFFATLP